MKILVIRSMALGDVLAITPVLTRLRQENPGAEIFVATNYNNVFESNPHINGVNVNQNYDKTINLDMAHESRRHLHAIDAYMEAAFGDTGNETTDKSIIFKAREIIPMTQQYEGHRIASIHPNASWQNRTMPNYWWDFLAKGLANAGYLVVTIGTKIDYCPPGTIDTRNRFHLKQQASLIEQSSVFICGPSGLFILAGATSTPVVVPMTINTPETCLPWRKGVLGLGFFPILADVPCIGCNAEQGDVTFVGCASPRKDESRGDYACISTIDVSVALTLALGAASCNQRY